jgi:glycosyltransferase involved in cell wall biosynthesis
MIKNTILVSVGLPVYNSENKNLDEVIKSILEQTYSNFELIISDNNSTDATYDIINKYKKIDNRIFYYKQKENINGIANFLFVLKNSKGKYFCWASDDDIYSNDYIEKNLYFLENNLGYIGSVSPSRFENYKINEKNMVDQTIDDENSIRRSLQFLSKPHSGARFKSLFRREMLISSDVFNENEFPGNDSLIIFKALLNGKMKKISEGSLIIGKKGISSNLRSIMEHMKVSYLDLFFFYNNYIKHALLHLKKKNIKVNTIYICYIFFIMVKLNVHFFYINVVKSNLYIFIKKYKTLKINKFDN